MLDYQQYAVPRRQVAILVHPELLQSIFTKGYTIPFDVRDECIVGLPTTAKFIGAQYDAERTQFYLVFEDESFEEVGFGSPRPILIPRFQREHRATI